MKLSLMFPIGVLVAGATSKVWVRVQDSRNGDAVARTVRYRWRRSTPSTAGVGDTDGVLTGFSEDGVDVEVTVMAPEGDGAYALELYAADEPGSESGSAPIRIPVTVIQKDDVRSYLLDGINPLSYAWGVDRGVAVHRMHLEQFLSEHSADIKGRCLEFQEPRYVPRLGGPAVQTLDILHADATNPRATLIADLTRPNDLPDARFDCIVCTHVLQSIFGLERAIGELYRILAHGGVLLVGVPQISMFDSRYGELWRFTPDGLSQLLTTVFAPVDVAVAYYGNSLTAAGELRGMVASEFSAEALSTHDRRFATEICARAVKR